MYGGHITDDWDRNLCKTYLQVYMHPDMVRAYVVFIKSLFVLFFLLSLQIVKCL